MIRLEDSLLVAREIKIKIEFQNLADKIQTSQTKPAIIKAAESAFDQAKGLWKPALTCQWVQYTPGKTKGTGTLIPQGGLPVKIHAGHSQQFLAPAVHALAAVYTTGPEMDEMASKASRDKDFLTAHFMDLLGLVVLGKVEEIVKQRVEKKAAELGWGVSPFLSPGSVHGWELEGQAGLASLLPIKDIGITLSDGVFSPFKTISCLIGIGPQYPSRRVGTTCRVCSRRDNCKIRQNHTGHSS